MRRHLSFSALLTSALAMCSACADDSPEQTGEATPLAAQADAPREAVTLRFKAKVFDEDFVCGRDYPGQGKTKISATPQDFRFFVENVRLISETGEEVPVVLDERDPYQTSALALIDFTNQDGRCTSGGAGTNLTIAGTVPTGRYRGVVFSNGVPEQLNHADPTLAPTPLQAPGASWNWLLGYRFVMAEFVSSARPVAGGSAPGVHGGMAADAGTPPSMGDAGMMMTQTPGLGMAHLGSTACSGSPAFGLKCQKQNRTEIRLADFDPSVNTIVADFGAIFRNSDLTAGAQCHASSELCVPMFEALGIDYATGKPLSTQSVFRVE